MTDPKPPQIFLPKKHHNCVIVGVLNEGERFATQLDSMVAHAEGVVDIIVADGGSTDGATSPDVLKDKVHALIVRTGGLSEQYRAALQFALDEGYEGIVTVDGNNKDGMDALARFAAALDDGYDLVQGSRFIEGGQHDNTPINRLIGIRLIFSPLMHLFTGFAYTDAINGFKAFSRKMLLDERVAPFRPIFNNYSLQYYLNYRAPKLKMRVTEIPVRRSYPAKGKTPTKIKFLSGRIMILKELFKTLFGFYNPR